MFEWWGLSLNSTLLIAALILLAVDFLLQLEGPTIAAWALITYVVTSSVDGPPLVQLLVATLVFTGLVAFHYQVWRRWLSHVANHFLAPSHYSSGPERLNGKEGTIVAVEGRSVVRVEGDVWEFRSPSQLNPGDAVVVVGVGEGALKVVGKRYSESEEEVS